VSDVPRQTIAKSKKQKAKSKNMNNYPSLALHQMQPNAKDPQKVSLTLSLTLWRYCSTGEEWEELEGGGNLSNTE
jgi:hypothetical protein